MIKLLNSFVKLNSRLYTKLLLLSVFSIMAIILLNSFVNSSINTQIQENIFGDTPYQASHTYSIDGLIGGATVGDTLDWDDVSDNVSVAARSITEDHLETVDRNDLISTTLSITYYEDFPANIGNPVPPTTFDVFVVENGVFEDLLSGTRSSEYTEGGDRMFGDENFNFTLTFGGRFEAIIVNSSRIPLNPLGDTESYIVSSNTQNYTVADFYYGQFSLSALSRIGIDIDSTYNMIVKESQLDSIRSIPFAGGSGRSVRFITQFSFRRDSVSLDNIDTVTKAIDSFLGELKNNLAIQYARVGLQYTYLNDFNLLESRETEINNEYLVVAIYLSVSKATIFVTYIIASLLIIYRVREEFLTVKRSMALLKQERRFSLYSFGILVGSLVLAYASAVVFDVFLVVIINATHILPDQIELYHRGIDRAYVQISLTIVAFLEYQLLHQERELRSNKTLYGLLLSITLYITIVLTNLVINENLAIQDLQVSWFLFLVTVSTSLTLLAGLTLMQSSNTKLKINTKSSQIPSSTKSKLRKKVIETQIIKKSWPVFLSTLSIMFLLIIFLMVSKQSMTELRVTRYYESPGELKMTSGITFDGYDSFSTQLNDYLTDSNLSYVSILISDDTLTSIEGRNLRTVSITGDLDMLAQQAPSTTVREEVGIINSLTTGSFINSGASTMGEEYKQGKSYAFLPSFGEGSIVLRNIGTLREIPGLKDSEKRDMLVIDLDSMLNLTNPEVVMNIVTYVWDVRDDSQVRKLRNLKLGEVSLTSDNQRVVNIESLLTLIEQYNILFITFLTVVILLIYNEYRKEIQRLSVLIGVFLKNLSLPHNLNAVEFRRVYGQYQVKWVLTSLPFIVMSSIGVRSALARSAILSLDAEVLIGAVIMGSFAAVDFLISSVSLPSREIEEMN